MIFLYLLLTVFLFFFLNFIIQVFNLHPTNPEEQRPFPLVRRPKNSDAVTTYTHLGCDFSPCRSPFTTCGQDFQRGNKVHHNFAFQHECCISIATGLKR